MRALEAQGRSPTTQAIARTILRRSLRHAERFGRVTRNVAALTDPPKRSGHKLDDSLSAEEAAQVIQAAKGDRLGALAIFVLSTGARQAEVLDLRWGDLDLDAGIATIHGTKSRSSDRKIALAPFVVTALRDHRKRQAVEHLAARSWPTRSPAGLHHHHRDPLPREERLGLVEPVDCASWGGPAPLPRHSPHGRHADAERRRPPRGRLRDAWPLRLRHHQGHLRQGPARAATHSRRRHGAAVGAGVKPEEHGTADLPRLERALALAASRADADRQADPDRWARAAEAHLAIALRAEAPLLA